MKQKYTKEYKLQALELVNQLGSYAEASESTHSNQCEADSIRK